MDDIQTALAKVRKARERDLFDSDCVRSCDKGFALLEALLLEFYAAGLDPHRATAAALAAYIAPAADAALAAKQAKEAT